MTTFDLKTLNLAEDNTYNVSVKAKGMNWKDSEASVEARYSPGIKGTWLMNETLLLNTSLSSDGGQNSYSVTGFYNSINENGELVEVPLTSIRTYRWRSASDIELVCGDNAYKYRTDNIYYYNNETSLTGPMRVYFDGNTPIAYKSSGVHWEKLRTFTITGGADLENEQFIKLISENAIKVG